ncbi:hypothetical protein MJG53_006454 [Ovis ammon polii x Ovis aries]|uniref:Uncharacterized protein n=1 Tax=Ovis ammon polii x Ovis aries TaxID=2918886 RepID=A0ACB9V633_9CETA|nr:hypothetical protein MJG53_006454 [Ovis ammon polii x Ovis aries]
MYEQRRGHAENESSMSLRERRVASLYNLWALVFRSQNFCEPTFCPNSIPTGLICSMWELLAVAYELLHVGSSSLTRASIEHNGCNIRAFDQGGIGLHKLPWNLTRWYFAISIQMSSQILRHTDSKFLVINFFFTYKFLYTNTKLGTWFSSDWETKIPHAMQPKSKQANKCHRGTHTVQKKRQTDCNLLNNFAMAILHSTE